MTDETQHSRVLVECAVAQTRVQMKIEELEKWKLKKETEDEVRDTTISDLKAWQGRALLIIMIGAGVISVIYDLIKPKLLSFFGG